MHPFVIVAPELITARGSQALTEYGASPDENGRPTPFLDADGAPTILPDIQVAYAHLVIQTYAADASRVTELDPAALTEGLDDAAAAAEALRALAVRKGWPEHLVGELAPADVVAWAESGAPPSETRELTWTLLYFRPVE